MKKRMRRSVWFGLCVVAIYTACYLWVSRIYSWSPEIVFEERGLEGNEVFFGVSRKEANAQGGSNPVLILKTAKRARFLYRLFSPAIWIESTIGGKEFVTVEEIIDFGDLEREIKEMENY